MELYIPVLVLGGLAFLFAAGSVAMSSAVGPKRYNRAKLDSYECGIEPTPQALGGGKFRVTLENGHSLIAYTAGKMRRYRIRMAPGDRVSVQVSTYDPTRGRIVYRHR